MKRKVLKEVIIVILMFIILFFVLKDNFFATIKIIGGINILLFILTLIIFVIYFTLEACVLYMLIKEYKKDYEFKEAFKLSIVTKFFNGITPFSTGGRPFQVIELKKSGVRTLDGTNVIVQNIVIFQISLVLFSLLGFFLNFAFNFFPVDTFLYRMTVLGFIINVAMFLIILLFSASKSLNKKIVNFIVNTLYTIKIIKDKDALYEKISNTCDDYYNAFKDFKYKKDLILKTVGIYILSLIVYNSIVIFVMFSLNIPVSNAFVITVACNFVFLAGCYVPIPGGSGGIEYAFVSYYTGFMNPEEISSCLIIWRFVTYYLPTLIGGILFNTKNKK